MTRPDHIPRVAALLPADHIPRVAALLPADIRLFSVGTLTSGD